MYCEGFHDTWVCQENKLQIFTAQLPLSEYYTPNQKLVCFVLYLKTINSFQETKMCIL